MKLENKVAVITGGGTGIGRAIAIKYAEEGAKTAVENFTRCWALELASDDASYVSGSIYEVDGAQGAV